MFTGIVQRLGVVQALTVQPGGGLLVVREPELAPALRRGESVAVNGVCLTVAEVSPPTFVFHMMPETLRRSNLGDLQRGDQVHLEQALQPTDRLGGHFVQGHVDATGTIAERVPEGDAVLVRFTAPAEVLRYLVEKGPIAVDGVSLTVMRVEDTSFWVSLVQYTQEHTTLTRRPLGGRVNLEVDLLAKYVERLLGPLVPQYAAPGEGR